MTRTDPSLAARHAHAAAFGKAVGQRFLDDFATYPKQFPKGPSSLAGIASRIARVQLFAACTWTPTEDEEEQAAGAAERTVQLAQAGQHTP